jgi:2-phospho-L-lactate transferase/gluconeogenesis factor (CofD/UPF0052 family)
MKVLIFSGGTGSIALQTGFEKYYPGLLDVQILTNAYDNGKSTGAVRQVYDGKILGPSDVRKNQTTQYKLKYCKNDSDNLILRFLEHRFDCATEDAEQYCLSVLDSLYEKYSNLHVEEIVLMRDAIKHFFNQPKSHQITYKDFSLSNIIYAGLAGKNNYSLATAGKLMAGVLRLPEDSVILNDDKSLFLRAVTQSGRHILDEGEIVEWNNAEDKISRIYFVGSDGCEDFPELSQQAIDAIESADLIVFSSGTQWSSLIPTYVSSMHKFRGIIERAKAKKFLIMNNQQDHDMYGCDVNYVLDVLYDFIPLDNIEKIFNTVADKEMTLDKVNGDKLKCHEFVLSSVKHYSRTHDPRVAAAVMNVYYQKYLTNEKIIFDYDDTLVGRNNEFKDESNFNLRMITKLEDKIPLIFTGNYVKALNLNGQPSTLNILIRDYEALNCCWPSERKEINFLIYGDGGANLYKARGLNIIDFVTTINQDALFLNEEVNKIVHIIESLGINASKIQNRNNATISIKPIDDEYRIPICHLLENALGVYKLHIRPTGRTTIDISKRLNNKDLAFNHLKNSLNPHERVTYVGDESHEGGNDYILMQNNIVDYLHVDNPRDTTIFLLTVNYAKELNMVIE